MMKTRNRKATLELLSIPKYQTEKFMPPKPKQVHDQFENYAAAPQRGTLNIKQGIYSSNKVIQTLDAKFKQREIPALDIQKNHKIFIKNESDTNLKTEIIEEVPRMVQLQQKTKKKHKYSIHKRRSDEGSKQINIRLNNEPSSYMSQNNEIRDIDFEGEIESYFEVLKNSISGIIEEKLKSTLNPFMESIGQRFNDLSVELKNQDNNALKTSKEINSKICQYGEHHSRHLHYLCMRSEYEKLAQISFINNNNNKEVLNNLSQSKLNDSPISKCSCSDIKPNVMNGNKQISQSKANDEQNSEINNTEQTLNNNNQQTENQMSISYLLGELKKRNSTTTDGNLQAPPSTPFIQNNNLVNPVNQVNVSTKSSELGLKEILATIQQYYPPTSDGHSGDDLSRSFSKLHMGNGDYNDSDEDDEFSDENTQ